MAIGGAILWALHPFYTDHQDITLRTWTEYVDDKAVKGDPVKQWRLKIPEGFPPPIRFTPGPTLHLIWISLGQKEEARVFS